MLEKYAWVPTAALLIGALVRAMKAGWWPELLYVNPKYKPWIAFAAGWLSGSLDSLVTGKPVVEATIGGLVSALTAVGGHELLIEGLRGGRELFAAPKGK